MTFSRHIISIIEDDPAVREGLQLMLERAGYSTRLHADPREALADTETFPDAFIIDRQLSGIDGLEVCRQLKSRPASARIPVIIISASPQVARLAEAAQADGFLEKPFRSADLLARIRECLSK